MSARGRLGYAAAAVLALAGVASAVTCLGACLGEEGLPPTQGLRDGGIVGSTDADPPTVTRSIKCNGDAVCSGFDVCCSSKSAWAKNTTTCKPTCGGERTIACDDAADCATGQVCCMTTDGASQALGAACASSCSGGQQQLCSIEASECTGGKSCSPLTTFSPAGLSTCK